MIQAVGKRLFDSLERSYAISPTTKNRHCKKTIVVAVALFLGIAG